MDENTILHRAGDVSFEVVAGEAILIDMQTGTYFSLNEVGTVFWQSLDGERSLSALAAQIAGTYHDKTARFVADLRKLATAGETRRSQLADLAHTYLIETEEVQDYVDRLREGDPGHAADELIADLTIDVPTVFSDLMELAETMLADKLLIVVK